MSELISKRVGVEIAQLVMRARQAEAEAQRLREALQPFADLLERWERLREALRYVRADPRFPVRLRGMVDEALAGREGE